MNARMLWALVSKDIVLYFKNRFFAFITVLGLVFYVAVFYLLPQSVDETLSLAWTGPMLPGVSLEELEADGLVLKTYDSDAALQQAVLAGDEPMGISLPEGFFQQLEQGQNPRITLYFQSELPDEYRAAYTLLMEEISFSLSGQPLNIEAEEVMLGPDMAGQQIPPRERMLPVLVVFVLALETMGLAALFTSEVESGTLRALLVTPLRLGGLFLTKGVSGVLMAFTQVILLLLITGGLRSEPLLLITTLLLGALLVTGISFLIASVGRDMMSVMGWGGLAMIVLAIPSLNILLPGLASGWIRIIPSYYLIDAVYQVMNFGAGWAQVSTSLLALTAFAVTFLGLGLLTMQRRMQ
jgi:ABC-2 type transport system permease protein